MLILYEHPFALYCQKVLIALNEIGVAYDVRDTFTIAECAAAPGLFYALALHPWDDRAHPGLTRYYRGLAQRPSIAKVIADARAYRHLFPLPWPADFDRYHGLG